MHHSPILRMLGMASWVITACASINILTSTYGYDFFAWLMNMMPGMIMPMMWIVGIAGILSLVMFVKASFMCCPGCGQCPCSCK
jgi:hypothetical protein